MIVLNMMDTWSTCNVTIAKTSSMRKKVWWSNFPLHQCTDKSLLFSSFILVPMLIAISFFCCCLILIWFCTLQTHLVLKFVVLLAVLSSFAIVCFTVFCIFGVVLFCIVFLILLLFHNLIFTSSFFFHNLFSVFLVLFYFYHCYYFVAISQPYMLSQHVRQRKKLQNACCPFF